MQIFSEWLERMRRKINLDGESWLLDLAIEYVKRFDPLPDWDELLAGGVRRVQVSIESENSWDYDNGWQVSPILYGESFCAIVAPSRGRTFEGRLTLQELAARLRRVFRGRE
jgi:hypothetical protein